MSKLFESAKKIIFITALICSQTITGFSQDLQPPIPVELLFGHEALVFTTSFGEGFFTNQQIFTFQSGNLFCQL